MATMWMTEKTIQNAVFPLPKTCRVPRAGLRDRRKLLPAHLPLEVVGETGGAGPSVGQGRGNALLQEVERMKRWRGGGGGRGGRGRRGAREGGACACAGPELVQASPRPAPRRR